MKILITGENGYIAKSIYSALYSKYDITTVTRQDFDLTCWASTSEFFHDKSFDVVIHTATSGGSRLKEETDLVIRENLLMYRNLLNHQDKFTKFISFGSGAELNNPVTPYGISKQAIADSMFSKPNFLNLRIFFSKVIVASKCFSHIKTKDYLTREAVARTLRSALT